MLFPFQRGARGFTWYQHCADWIDEFREIIVFGDNENGQVTLVNELQARVSQRVRVVRIKDYLGEKGMQTISCGSMAKAQSCRRSKTQRCQS